MERSSHDPTNLAILERLRNSAAPISGEVLGHELGLSRVALWKRMEHLRNSGCTIQSSRLGYLLVDEDLIIDPDTCPKDQDLTVRPSLPGPVVWTEECDSTMDRARDLAFDQAAHGTMVIAERQNDGRGQQGRKWLSPPGGIYASLILRSPIPLCRSGTIVAEAARFICSYLGKESGVEVKFQWPNDLMSGSAKLGGFLVETWGSPDRPAFQVLGFGLNRHAPPLPDRPVAGLTTLASHPPRRREILAALASHMTTWSLAPVFDIPAWTGVLGFLGHKTAWTDWQGIEHTGICTGMDSYASLLMEAGQIRFGESRKIRYFE